MNEQSNSAQEGSAKGITVDQRAAAFAMVERHPLDLALIYVNGPSSDKHFGTHLGPGCWLLRKGHEPVLANDPSMWL